MTRIIVTGWRHAKPAHRPEIVHALRCGVMLCGGVPNGQIILVHGAADGVDLIAVAIATGWGWDVEGHEAQWRTFGTKAGPIRNRHMVSRGADIVVGLPGPGSRGTWDCLRAAATALIPAYLHPLAELTDVAPTGGDQLAERPPHPSLETRRDRAPEQIGAGRP